MRTVKVRCRGVSPLLMDKMVENLCLWVGKDPRANKTPMQLAREKIYRDEKHRIVLPIEMLMGALVFAGRWIKNSGRFISTSRKTTLFDFFAIQGSFLSLTDGKGKRPKMTLDNRRGICLQTRVSVSIVRPKFVDWGFNVTFTYDETKISSEMMRQLFDRAGFSEGLGSFRANKHGPYGRFEVVRWTEAEMKNKQVA